MKRIHYFSGLLFFILAGCSDSKETRMQRFLVQGNEKIRTQEYEQAEKFFLSALKLDTCFADALNNLGTVEERRRNLPSAIRYYSKALQCNDRFFLALFNRANAYFENSQFPQALEDVTLADKIHPDSLNVLELRGLILWKMQLPDGAIASFRRMISIDPTEVNAHINLGTLYTSLNKFDSARFFLKRAEALEKDDARIANATAMLFAASGEPEQGLAYIDIALKMDSDDPYYLNNKGYILMSLNRLDDAKDFIDRSIAADPYNGWAYRNKGIFFLKSGNYPEAVRLLKKAEQMDPAIEDVSYWLGRALIKNNQTDKGCAHLKRPLTRTPAGEENLSSFCR